MHITKNTLSALLMLNLLSACTMLDNYYLGQTDSSSLAPVIDYPPVENVQQVDIEKPIEKQQLVEQKIQPPKPSSYTLPTTQPTTKLSHDSSVPFWGDKSSRPVETNPATLKPGQFIWKGAAIPSGPTVVIVSLPEQRAYVYRNGIRIGVSSVSTGKTGHSTPTGVFTVLNKDRSHRSKTYNNAPMPFSERLTWDGVALHAGDLPGYPSSHGCVHLPSEFARLLFQASPKGMTVVIANNAKQPEQVTHPAPLSPVDAKTGSVVKVPRLSASEEYRWHPEKSPEGPLSIIMSGADQRVLVFRNGTEIGRAKIGFNQGKPKLGTHAFIMQDQWGTGESPIAKGARAHRWISVGIPGHAHEDNIPVKPTAMNGIQLPQDFAKSLYGILEPGTTLLVTDAPVLEQQTTGVALNILNADKSE